MQLHLNPPTAPPRLVWWDWDLVSDRLVVRGGQDCLLGYQPGTLPETGAAWERAAHPDDLPQIRTALQACREGGAEDWCSEHRYLGADGAWKWVLDAGKVTARDPARRATRMLGFTLDISARRQAEAALRRDAELLANVKESIICTDLEGIVTYWNAGATELYGWTAAEMLGRPFYDRFPAGEAREQAYGRMKQAAQHGETRGEREDVRKDGAKIIVDSRAFAFHDPAGRPIGVIGMAHDITARRRAEAERLRLEQRLLQAQKMETVGTLAGGIAHEFNNILAAIIGNTELALLKHPDDTVFRAYHQSVLDASQRARELIRRILAFSRVHEPERRPVQLARLVGDAAAFIRAALPATVELQLDLAPDCPSTLADANQLQQVLLNLAANAAYAMREGGGRLAIRLRPVHFPAPYSTAFAMLPAGLYLALELADTGCGIEPEQQGRIFDPFFTTKPVGEGSGLGLAIVQGIIAGHGGGVDVASSAGAGTTFTLYLPVVHAIGRTGTPDFGVPQALPLGRGECIVVIDDEEPIALVTEGALRHLGYQVRRFSSAEAFWTDLSAAPFRFDLMVTDQAMPRLTGLELARRLRAEGRQTPIVIVSGDSRELTPDELALVGGITLLEKPFDLKLLAIMVDRLLHQSAA